MNIPNYNKDRVSVITRIAVSWGNIAFWVALLTNDQINMTESVYRGRKKTNGLHMVLEDSKTADEEVLVLKKI